MDFLQIDAEVWGTSSAILSGGSALVAILAGIEQTSSFSRARKNIEWLQASLQLEQVGPRREALEKKLIQNQAKIISWQEVPLWYLSPILFWPLMVALALYSASGDHNSLAGLITAAAGVILFGLNLIRTTIRAYCERVRVYYQFSSGRYKFRPAEIDILALMEGGTRKEFVQSGVLILATSVGFAALILSVKNGPDPWGIVVLIISAITVLITCIFIKDYAYTLAGDSTGGVSAFQRRLNLRRIANSFLGEEITSEVGEIEKSFQTIEQLRREVDEAMQAPRRVALSGKVQSLKADIRSIIGDLESLRDDILSTKDQDNHSQLIERQAQIEERINECTKNAGVIRLDWIE